MEDPELQERKRKEVEVRLQEREAQRLADLEKRKQDKESAADPTETFESFSQKFNPLRDEISQLTSSDHLKTLARDQVSPHLDKCSERTKALQEILAKSSHFLSPYDIRQSQETINKLGESIEKARLDMAPKKKFAFSSKREKPAATQSEVSPPTTSATSTTPAPTQQVKREFDPSKSLTNRTAETIIKRPGELAGNDFALVDLQGCTVYLCDSMSSMYIHLLKDCQIHCGPVTGSIFVSSCTNCTFSLASQQIRIHTSTSCDFYLHVRSDPIIEDCKAVRFSPYSFKYPLLSKHFEDAKLDSTVNNWQNIKDFKWLKATKSPNWDVVPTEDAKEFQAPAGSS